jgi:LacI family transcriptional regulator
MARVSQQMIAQHAGVSPTTVSLVLSANTRAQIAPATRERVLLVAEELGYMAPLLDRCRRAATGNLGYLLPPPRGHEPMPTDTHLADFRRGVLEVATAHEYHVLVATHDGQTAIPELVAQQKVDALIVDAIVEAAWINRLRERLPVVLVSGYIDPRMRVDTVVSDNQRGGFHAVEYLVGLGHRRIGLFGMAPLTVPYFHDRLVGFTQGLTAFGLSQDAIYQALPPAVERSHEEIRTAARETLTCWRHLPAPPTAVFALNDTYALGLYAAAAELGVRIPAELSVVGYDNSLPAHYSLPALTSIDRCADELGRAAVGQILAQLARPERPPVTMTVDVRMIARGSTGPVRGES